ncbi:MAG TPA: SUMF1/EgtB/PvdO family nonheme iron enzyme, partial [Pirellulales bacterium]|nr:SUMF1/EgtB/PvdO family nonheme iron enzyme [Pirellulales bacterium]
AEAPAHRVKISRPFLIGATEITVAQYRRFVDATAYVTETERFGGGDSTKKDEQDPKKKSLTWRRSRNGSNDTAVRQVTWNDAVAFCNWLSDEEKLSRCYGGGEQEGWLLEASGEGYRLPTEAEWEYACRAGTTTQYSFGDDPAKFAQFGWCLAVEAVPNPNPVAGKLPNPFGLYDLHGNLAEWCHDWFPSDYRTDFSSSDPAGPASGPTKVYRGGALDLPVVRCRSAFRGNFQPTARFYDLGFRVVRVSTAMAAGASSASAGQPVERMKPGQSAGKSRSLGDLNADEKGKSAVESKDRVTAEAAFALKRHTGAVTRVAFHPFLPLLVSGGKDGRVLMWDLEKQVVAGELDKFKEEVWTVKFTPDGQVVSYANRNHWGSTVPFKTVATASEIKRLKDFKFGGGAVGSIAYSPDGAFFAAGQDDGTIRLWETAAFLEHPPLSVGSDVMSLVFGPISFDRRRKPTKYLLAAGCKDGSIKMLEVVSIKDKNGLSWKFAPSKVAFPKLAGILCLRFSPDGKLLASAHSGGQISLWNPETAERSRDMANSSADAAWISFHPERPWLVAAHAQDHRAQIWNFKTGKALCELAGHAGDVLCAEFSRDGRQVATASEDFSIKLWNLTGDDVPPAPKRTKRAKAAPPLVGD